MTWFDRLLGIGAAAGPDSSPPGDPAPVPIPSLAERVTITHSGGHIASVRSIDFIGQFAVSPNKRFTLLWQDQMMINDALRGGRYVLIDDGRVVLDEGMARPQDGKVADNGSFILNDWGAMESLSGTFHAFSGDGRSIVARAFTANLLNNGLSRDGSRAVCQTCNAPKSPDSSVLCTFDLVAGREIACWQPETGWANDYEFPNGDRVRMIRRNGVPVDYSLGGEFLDRQKWFADDVARGVSSVIRYALEQGQAVTGLSLDALRAGATVALANPDPRWKADSLRLLGEIEDKAGNERGALDAFRQALAINPRIGVAKRAAALSKRLDH